MKAERVEVYRRMDSRYRVVRNPAARRFEVVNEPSAALNYSERAGLMRLIHTEVPAVLRGRGLGSLLAKAAFEYAREQHLRVEPLCPFVQAYLARRPEYLPLVAGGHQHTPAEEWHIREAALDETIEASFPASDPPSTDPNPDDDDALRRS